jgi:ATP-dependent DNA helicase RecG
LLFGTNPQKYLPAATLKVAFFADRDSNVYLNQKIIGGTLFEQYEQGMMFVESCFPPVVNTLSGTASRMQWVIPPDVIRELLLNAIIHRDYHAETESYCSVIRDVGIELYNPGLLPAPRITPETIYRDHPSIPANRRVARVFFLAGLIEQWGKGASRAWNLCRSQGLPEPVWTSENDMVWVRLFVKS